MNRKLISLVIIGCLVFTNCYGMEITKATRKRLKIEQQLQALVGDHSYESNEVRGDLYKRLAKNPTTSNEKRICLMWELSLGIFRLEEAPESYLERIIKSADGISSQAGIAVLLKILNEYMRSSDRYISLRINKMQQLVNIICGAAFAPTDYKEYAQAMLAAALVYRANHDARSEQSSGDDMRRAKKILRRLATNGTSFKIWAASVEEWKKLYGLFPWPGLYINIDCSSEQFFATPQK